MAFFTFIRLIPRVSMRPLKPLLPASTGNLNTFAPGESMQLSAVCWRGLLFPVWLGRCISDCDSCTLSFVANSQDHLSSGVNWNKNVLVPQIIIFPMISHNEPNLFFLLQKHMHTPTRALSYTQHELSLLLIALLWSQSFHTAQS